MFMNYSIAFSPGQICKLQPKTREIVRGSRGERVETRSFPSSSSQSRCLCRYLSVTLGTSEGGGEPLETLVETITRCGARRLDVL